MNENNDSILINSSFSHDTLEVFFNRTYNSYCLRMIPFDIKNRTLSLMDKLRWIWWIIKTGKPWTESVILTKPELKRVFDYCQNTDKNNAFIDVVADILIPVLPDEPPQELNKQLELDFDGSKDKKEFHFKSEEFQKKKVSKKSKTKTKDKRKLLLDNKE